MQFTKPTIGALLVATTLHACATPVTPRYSANTDNVLALRKLNANGVYVGEVAEPAKDNVKCRGIGKMRMHELLPVSWTPRQGVFETGGWRCNDGSSAGSSSSRR